MPFSMIQIIGTKSPDSDQDCAYQSETSQLIDQYLLPHPCFPFHKYLLFLRGKFDGFGVRSYKSSTTESIFETLGHPQHICEIFGKARENFYFLLFMVSHQHKLSSPNGKNVSHSKKIGNNLVWIADVSSAGLRVGSGHKKG